MDETRCDGKRNAPYVYACGNRAMSEGGEKGTYAKTLNSRDAGQVSLLKTHSQAPAEKHEGASLGHAGWEKECTVCLYTGGAAIAAPLPVLLIL